jgi:hypothetical protein
LDCHGFAGLDAFGEEPASARVMCIAWDLTAAGVSSRLTCCRKVSHMAGAVVLFSLALWTRFELRAAPG